MSEHVSWDPTAYGRFSAERSRPFADLLAQVRTEDPAVVVDLGCGHGPATLMLGELWPQARVIGVDASEAMLESARALDDAGRVEWVQADEPETDDEDDEPEDRQVYVPVWVCTDPAAAYLHYVHDLGREHSDTTGGLTDEQSATRSAEDEARREAESAERRRVIANNKAWKAAEVVRRQWLTGLLARRTVPAGTEVLIARAVVGREYTLSHAMEHGHEVLMNLLGVVPVEREAASYYGNRAMCAQVLDQATTPKAALMRTLAAVVAAWEQRADTHTWRNPTEWDDVIMTALIGWGYPASDVERLLLRSDSADAAR